MSRPTFKYEVGDFLVYTGNMGECKPGSLDGFVTARRCLLHGPQYRIKTLKRRVNWLPERLLAKSSEVVMASVARIITAQKVRDAGSAGKGLTITDAIKVAELDGVDPATKALLEVLFS